MIIPSAIPAMSPIAKSTIVFPLSYAQRRLVWRALEQTSCHDARFPGDMTTSPPCVDRGGHPKGCHDARFPGDMTTSPPCVDRGGHPQGCCAQDPALRERALRVPCSATRRAGGESVARDERPPLPILDVRTES